MEKKKYRLDFNEINTKEELHQLLKEELNFPDYYGANLDALYDVLTDMNDIEIEIINFKYFQEHNTRYANLLSDLFKEINDSNLQIKINY